MTRPTVPPPPDLSERPMGLNRRAIRAVYPQIDWDQYDREVGAEARQPYKDALRELVECVNALENRAIRSGGEFHVWAEERMLTDGRDKARSLLSDTEASRP